MYGWLKPSRRDTTQFPIAAWTTILPCLSSISWPTHTNWHLVRSVCEAGFPWNYSNWSRMSTRDHHATIFFSPCKCSLPQQENILSNQGTWFLEEMHACATSVFLDDQEARYSRSKRDPFVWSGCSRYGWVWYGPKEVTLTLVDSKETLRHHLS